IEFGRQVLEGYREAGVITVCKHYPGHGDTTVDSHEDLPVCPKPLEELEKVELRPFAELASFTDAVMTAHLLVPALDKENCSTVSRASIDYLRQKIGFQGVVVTDSLVMKGVLKGSSLEEVAVRALQAGCTMLLLGGKQLVGGDEKKVDLLQVRAICQYIICAVRDGRLSEELIDENVRKILALKARCEWLVPEEEDFLKREIHTKAHRELAKEVASKALKIIGSLSVLGSLKEQRIGIIAPKLLEENIYNSSLDKIGKNSTVFTFIGLDPSDEEVARVGKAIADAEALVVCSYNAWKNPNQQVLIEGLLKIGKPVVLIVTRDPIDASLFSGADLTYVTHSPTQVSMKAVYRSVVQGDSLF
ncbi:MAG: hypothetical protein HYZ48_02630, partial [Chlamydiales bacterium]|nr:hypothetical protein [Chlamydiales bacterium]